MKALAKIAQSVRPAPSGRGLIGVHFSRRELQLLQLRKAERLEVQAQASAPLLADRSELLESRPAIRTLLRRALKQAPFRGRNAISTLPFEHVKLMSVSYPAGPASSEAATISNLMAERVEGELSDYVIDYVPVRTSIREGERLCLVAVCPRDRVVDYLDTLHYAGLRVEALEVAPLSIRRLVERMSSPSNIENVLVVTTGQETTYLTLISGRRLLANQAVAFGEAHILKSICDALDVPMHVAANLLEKSGLSAAAPDDRPGDDLAIGNTLLEIVRPAFLGLVNEIERAFLYAASESYGQAAKRIYLFGALADWPGADALLESLTLAPVEPMRRELLPFHLDATASETPNSPASLSVAAGLALWGLDAND